MRKINYYSLALLSAMTVFGCSENDLFEASQNPNNAISFSTQAGKHSRATVLDNGNVGTGSYTKFGLYAYYTGQDSWNTGNNTVDPNFMKDQEVTCTSGVWSYDPLKYWPNTKDDKISFFAYMPKGDAGNAKTTADIDQTSFLPKITFKQDVANADKMVDFVVAQKLNQMKQTEAVVLPFQHVLTRLNFAAKVDKKLTDGSEASKSTTQVFVRGLRILGTADSKGINITTDASGENTDSRFFSEAVYQLNSSTDADKKNGTWDTESDAENSHTNRVSDPLELTSTILNVAIPNFNGYTTPSVAINQNASTTPLLKPSRTETVENSQVDKAAEYLFLIPPYGKEGIKSPSDIRVQLDYDIVTKDDNLTNKYSKTSTSATISLPNGSLKEGTAYNIVFTIGLTDVKVAAAVTDWQNDEMVDGGSTSNSDLVAGLKTLNEMKGLNPNSNYFTLDLTASTDVDLSLWKGNDRANFELGDQIKFRKNVNNVNETTIPYGWSYNSTTNVLTLNKYASITATSSSSIDIINGLKALNAMKSNNSYIDYCILNISGTVTNNTEVKSGDKSLYDLSLNDFNDIFGNSEVGDQIKLISDDISKISMKVPTGWKWDNTTGILEKTGDLLVFEKSSFYKWDACENVTANDAGHWGVGSSHRNDTNPNFASKSCKDCPTVDQIKVYINNSPYWDTGKFGDGIQTYYCYSNISTELVAYHTGIWLMKYDKCDKSNNLTDNNSSEDYKTGLTSDIRISGNYFFLPASGCYSDEAGVYMIGSSGYRWSSVPNTSNAFGLNFTSNKVIVYFAMRDYGFSLNTSEFPKN